MRKDAPTRRMTRRSLHSSGWIAISAGVIVACAGLSPRAAEPPREAVRVLPREPGVYYVKSWILVRE